MWSPRSALPAQIFCDEPGPVSMAKPIVIDLTIDDSDDISSDQYKDGDDEFN